MRMAVPSPNILLALFIISFSLSAIFHRSSSDPSDPAPPSILSRYAADILVPSTNDTFASRPAAFGTAFDDVLLGQLAKAWGDGLACESLNDMESFESSVLKGKIVLVERGRCSFVDKVRNVQQAGGIAAIVGDNVAETGFVTMYAKGDASDITIPSTFILHASYLSLSFLLSLHQPLDIMITPSEASDWPLLDTLLFIVVSPIFTLACIYIFLILRRRAQRRRELAPLSVVKSLPHRKWTREKSINEENGDPSTATTTTTAENYGTNHRRVKTLECVICLEDFVEGDECIILPCDHEFHDTCMYSSPSSWGASSVPHKEEHGLIFSTPWLTTRKRFCPICKRDIIVNETDEAGERSPLLSHRSGDDSSGEPTRDWRGDTAENV